MAGLKSLVATFGAPLPPSFPPLMPMYVRTVSVELNDSAKREASANITATSCLIGEEQKTIANQRDVTSNNLHYEPIKISMAKGGQLQTQVASLATPTTLVISNIPSRCTVWEVLDLIQASGFQGCFEYLYLAMKPGVRQNKGYGFAAFADANLAAEFQRVLEGSQFRSRASSKSIGVEVARTHVPMGELPAKRFQTHESPLGPILELSQR